MHKTDTIGIISGNCTLNRLAAASFIRDAVALLLVLFLFPFAGLHAQDSFTDDKKEAPVTYDEIPVHVTVNGYGNFYLDVIYTNKDLLYINVADLFRTLSIPCVIGQKGDSIGGFIETENRKYSIDFPTGEITIGDRKINPENRLIKDMGSLYMESSLFAEVFGISMNFNYRALTINMKSNFELPLVKQARIQKLRNNISKLKGEEPADTVVKRNYHLFKAGTFDWAAGSSQIWNGPTNNRLSIALGSELLFGEADVSYNYYGEQRFNNRQLLYLWRWVDNDNPVVRQAQVGTIPYQTIAFICSPIVGAVIRNASTTIRKASGYYTINDYTEPNWTVELYINNTLVGYTNADPSGFYSFKVPIIYGYTSLKLKFYGPMGEERTDERTLNVPYTVMPTHGFEYGLSGGIVQDGASSRFGQAKVNYGVNRFLTIGGGLEYLSSIPKNPFIPYVNATIQPFRKLILNGEYAHGVRAAGVLDYFFWKDALLEISYANYVKGQLATRFNANEERKARLSVPFKIKSLNGFAKLDFTQLVYTGFYYTETNVMLSAYYKQYSVNSTTQLNWVDRNKPYMSTDLALTARLRKGYSVRASAQYNISSSSFMTCNLALEKGIQNAYFVLAYQRNVMSQDNYFSLSIKYDLPFARTNFSVSHSRGVVNTYEGAQGSIAMGSNSNDTHFSNNSSVTKGGILIYPFLDMNNNGVFDKGERMVRVNSIIVTGGNPIYSKKDLIVRIPDLNSFVTYDVTFNDNSLENISWRFKHKVYRVVVDPNQFKRIDVPIVPVGEATGMVYLDKGKLLKGIGRILVKFYNRENNKYVAETLSESDGYIDFIGLEPGNYIACIDSAQLSKLGMAVDPFRRNFTVQASEDGMVIRDLEFVLQPGLTEPTLPTMNPGLSSRREK